MTGAVSFEFSTGRESRNVEAPPRAKSVARGTARDGETTGKTNGSSVHHDQVGNLVSLELTLLPLGVLLLVLSSPFELVRSFLVGRSVEAIMETVNESESPRVIEQRVERVEKLRRAQRRRHRSSQNAISPSSSAPPQKWFVLPRRARFELTGNATAGWSSRNAKASSSDEQPRRSQDARRSFRSQQHHQRSRSAGNEIQGAQTRAWDPHLCRLWWM